MLQGNQDTVDEQTRLLILFFFILFIESTALQEKHIWSVHYARFFQEKQRNQERVREKERNEKMSFDREVNVFFFSWMECLSFWLWLIFFSLFTWCLFAYGLLDYHTQETEDIISRVETQMIQNLMKKIHILHSESYNGITRHFVALRVTFIPADDDNKNISEWWSGAFSVLVCVCAVCIRWHGRTCIFSILVYMCRNMRTISERIAIIHVHNNLNSWELMVNSEGKHAKTRFLSTYSLMEIRVCLGGFCGKVLGNYVRSRTVSRVTFTIYYVMLFVIFLVCPCVFTSFHQHGKNRVQFIFFAFAHNLSFSFRRHASSTHIREHIRYIVAEYAKSNLLAVFMILLIQIIL